ncbi:Zn-dependent hydrolase [Bauldia sp.]|uniref:Zn-dependent hydrolase n=1 Tax=Bauldia sp. TaxID=2575872 RepID=UPI0025BF4E80|nr:Zn-dependent hydrolase [Bauldia sp.]
MSNQETGTETRRLTINRDRLRAEMEDLGEIGRTEGVPGINRPGFSDADMAARAFMADRMKALGLLVSMDAVGNLSGLWKTGEGPAVMVGSHLDTVPMGGFYDGALGVAAAMECVRALMDAGVTPPCPIEVIATAEEEGRFGGMLGSQALAGAVDPAWLETAVDEDGTRLVDAMTAHGLVPGAYETARRNPDSVKAFLELHIEQGPVLEAEGIPIGIVEGISGVFKWSVRLTGVANHAGTTPMDLRKDAFVGLVDFARQIPAIIAGAGTDQSRVTIGAVELKPNHPHTIPGEAVFTLIGRDISPDVMRALADASRRTLEAVAARFGLGLAIDEQSWLDPKPCDREVIAAFARQAERLGLAYKVMPSGAGHDTQFMADLTRAGLIFVPSIGGISHAPEEETAWSDIEAGVNLLLNTITDLAAR